MPYFQAFQPVSVTVTFFMNSITFVMNHLFSYFDISICHSSNRTLSYRLLLTHGFNHGYVLGGACYIHLTTRTYISCMWKIHIQLFYFNTLPWKYLYLFSIFQGYFMKFSPPWPSAVHVISVPIDVSELPYSSKKRKLPPV